MDTLVALGWAHHALGDTAEAEAAFAKARLLDPNCPNLPKPGTKEFMPTSSQHTASGKLKIASVWFHLLFAPAGRKQSFVRSR